MTFELGRVVATPACLELLSAHGVNALDLVQRHHSGDWGNLGQEDKRANEAAIAYGARILSAYIVGGVKCYMITEADRSSTCLMIASEY